jgi:hypothetical protein
MSEWPRYDGAKPPKEQWTSGGTVELRPAISHKDALLFINGLQSKLEKAYGVIEDLVSGFRQWNHVSIIDPVQFQRDRQTWEKLATARVAKAQAFLSKRPGYSSLHFGANQI